MGNATDHTFTYEKVDGNVGCADIIDGVIVMSISNICSLSNGVHESSHGYDFGKNGKYTKSEFLPGEVKAYDRQFF